MVIRKPVPSTDGHPASSSAPYPITPDTERPPYPATNAFTSPSQIFSHDLNNSPAFSLQPLDEAQRSPINSVGNPWASEYRGANTKEDLPPALRVGPRPDVKLSPGPIPTPFQADASWDKITPRSSSESERSHNFWEDDDKEDNTISKPVAGSVPSEHDPWAVFRTPLPAIDQPGPAPPEQGVIQEPADQRSQHAQTSHLANPLVPAVTGSNNPFRRNPSSDFSNGIPVEPLNPSATGGSDFARSERPQTSANLSTADRYISEYSTSYTPAPTVPPQSAPNVGPPSISTVSVAQPTQGQPQTTTTVNHGRLEQQPPLIPVLTEADSAQNPWSDSVHDSGKQKDSINYAEPSGSIQTDDAFDNPFLLQQTGTDQGTASQDLNLPIRMAPTEATPWDEELPPPKPPRPVPQVHHATAAELESLQRQRSETYQIKQFNWFDLKSSVLRKSSMLIQNKNGPCPLLALVNALILSNKDDSQSALGKALASREHISLGLIIESLIDELTSESATMDIELPDVDDLNRFLMTLHTGLNANPKFVIAGAPVNLMDVRNSMLHLPSFVDEQSLGGFEMTGDITLYGAFTIPLVHGWIPPPSHPAAAAFKRSAQTYEDAQTILFGEEELESRLAAGLSPEEEQLLQDIVTIKDFFKAYPTQLTPHGLQLLHDKLAPGSFAILFRNDHFSTIFKHPESGQIFSLVTDAGYATHDEVIWESLVDVSGQDNDLYSGDFRPVGNTPQDVSSADPSQRQSQPTADEATLPQSPANLEQADADFALALQMQEEEEQRAETSRRNRASSTSNQNANRNTGRRTSRPSQSSQQDIRPLIPPRTIRQSAAQGVNRPATDDGDAPPPTYDEAAQGEPYIPREENAPYVHNRQPSSSTAPLDPSSGRFSGGRTPSHQQNHVQLQSSLGQPLGRNPAITNGRQKEKEKDCIVM